MKSLKKKGFVITEVPSLIVILLVIAIVIGVGATILSQVRDTSSITSTTSTRFYANSTVVGLNSTAVDFTPAALAVDGSGKQYLVPASCTAVEVAQGLTDLAENFTVSNCLLTVTDVEYNNTNLKVNFTYTHNVYSIPYNITTEGLEGQEDLSGWQSTWVVIIAAAVVIGIVGKYLFFN